MKFDVVVQTTKPAQMGDNDVAGKLRRCDAGLALAAVRASVASDVLSARSGNSGTQAGTQAQLHAGLYLISQHSRTNF